MPQFNEPWMVRPHSLENQLVKTVEWPGETWEYCSWDIVGQGSESTLAEVTYCTASSKWSGIKDLAQAIATRDRIVLCVNACAGISNEELKEIAAMPISTPTPTPLADHLAS